MSAYGARAAASMRVSVRMIRRMAWEAMNDCVAEQMMDMPPSMDCLYEW